MLFTKRKISILRCDNGYWQKSAGESFLTSFLTTRSAIKVFTIGYRRTKLIVLHLVHPLDLCCDNCIRRKNPTHRFESIYDIIGFLDTSFGREPISRPIDDKGSDLGPTTPVKTWGNLRPGNHLTIRRRVLERWRYECWMRDYRLCSWGSVGVMPDPVLSKLASSNEIKTIDDLLEAVPGWDYADKYCREILLLLKDADQEHQLGSQG